MKTLPRIFAMSMAAACAMPAFAQQPQPAEPGFFRPSASASLTNAEPPAPPPQPAMPQAAAVPEPQPAPDPLAPLRWTEEQMDRAELEASLARRQAGTGPVRLNGAFDGSTDPRDR